jgi:hypothetical protein
MVILYLLYHQGQSVHFYVIMSFYTVMQITFDIETLPLSFSTYCRGFDTILTKEKNSISIRKTYIELKLSISFKV